MQHPGERGEQAGLVGGRDVEVPAPGRDRGRDHDAHLPHPRSRLEHLAVADDHRARVHHEVRGWRAGDALDQAPVVAGDERPRRIDACPELGAVLAVEAPRPVGE